MSDILGQYENTNEDDFTEFIEESIEYFGHEFSETEQDGMYCLKDIFLQIENLSDRKKEFGYFLGVYSAFLKNASDRSLMRGNKSDNYNSHPSKKIEANIRAAQRVLDSLNMKQGFDDDNTHQLGDLLDTYIEENKKTLEIGRYWHESSLNFKDYRLRKYTKKSQFGSFSLKGIIKKYNIKISTFELKRVIDSL